MLLPFNIHFYFQFDENYIIWSTYCVFKKLPEKFLRLKDIIFLSNPVIKQSWQVMSVAHLTFKYEFMAFTSSLTLGQFPLLICAPTSKEGVIIPT